MLQIKTLHNVAWLLIFFVTQAHAFQKNEPGLKQLAAMDLIARVQITKMTEELRGAMVFRRAHAEVKEQINGKVSEFDFDYRLPAKVGFMKWEPLLMFDFEVGREYVICCKKENGESDLQIRLIFRVLDPDSQL